MKPDGLCNQRRWTRCNGTQFTKIGLNAVVKSWITDTALGDVSGNVVEHDDSRLSSLPTSGEFDYYTRSTSIGVLQVHVHRGMLYGAISM